MAVRLAPKGVLARSTPEWEWSSVMAVRLAPKGLWARSTTDWEWSSVMAVRLAPKGLWARSTPEWEWSSVMAVRLVLNGLWAINIRFTGSSGMNINELKALRGTVGLRLGEKGEFRRVQEDIVALVTKVAGLEKNTRVIVKEIGVVLDGTEVEDAGVAFSARLSSHILFRPGETLLFDDVMMNAGSGFKGSSGEFTAPLSGRYLFTVTVRAQFHKMVSAELAGNGRMLARVTSGYGAIERATSSVTVVVELKRGDVISVRQASDKTGEYYGNGYSAFSGFLFD
ncbi:complement C1q-like protein 2 [Mya arenaria]|uniref:complement C1q-like protein 2 n=1 Tax=Mya arenaria TaxID=6604 RepID=UPI0022E1669C|nr:complement C1q-like protein 2 [Mya arenaria]